MRVLVVYGTTEGQTRKVAERIAERLHEHGPAAEVFDSTALPPDLQVDAYDAVIVAASVHQYRHQASVVHFVTANLAALSARPTAFISVSLAALAEDSRTEAQSYVDRFLEETGWQPTETLLVAGALLYTQYDFFKRMMMKFIVATHGGPTDSSEDYEFTDWDALSRFVDAFVEKISS